jgi:hypothetical protein
LDVGADEVLIGEVEARGLTAPATMRSGRLKKYWSWELPMEQ